MKKFYKEKDLKVLSILTGPFVDEEAQTMKTELIVASTDIKPLESIVTYAESKLHFTRFIQPIEADGYLVSSIPFIMKIYSSFLGNSSGVFKNRVGRCLAFIVHDKTSKTYEYLKQIVIVLASLTKGASFAAVAQTKNREILNGPSTVAPPPPVKEETKVSCLIIKTFCYDKATLCRNKKF